MLNVYERVLKLATTGSKISFGFLDVLSSVRLVLSLHCSRLPLSLCNFSVGSNEHEAQEQDHGTMVKTREIA